MTLFHLREQWLQSALADIPLQGPKTDSLIIEVAGKSGKTIRGRMACFDGACKSQALVVDRFRGHLRNGNVIHIHPEKFAPGFRPDLSICLKLLGELKSPNGRFGPAAKDAIRGAGIEMLRAQRLLNLSHFRPA